MTIRSQYILWVFWRVWKKHFEVVFMPKSRLWIKCATTVRKTAVMTSRHAGTYEFRLNLKFICFKWKMRWYRIWWLKFCQKCVLGPVNDNEVVHFVIMNQSYWRSFSMSLEINKLLKLQWSVITNTVLRYK